MSAYTTQLRTLIEQATQYETGLTTRDKIERGRKSLFDFDYPIFDEAYRKVFETNFIRHFYMREIGFETEGLFKFNLESWLLLHMPYFNKLFESELIDFDPLENSRYDVSSNKTTDTTANETKNTRANVSSTGNSNTTESSDTTNTVTEDNFERKIDADTPDTRLALTTNDGEGILEYASKINEESENNSSTSNGSVDGTQNTTLSSDENSTIDDSANKNINDVEDYISQRAGKIGVQTYSKMLMEYRQSFLRIEKQMFEEMQQLFMLVY